MKISLLIAIAILTTFSFISCSNPLTSKETDTHISYPSMNELKTKIINNKNPFDVVTESKEETTQVEENGISLEKTEDLYNQLKDKKWNLRKDNLSGAIKASNLTVESNIKGHLLLNVKNKNIEIGLDDNYVINYVNAPFGILENRLLNAKITDKGNYFEIIDSKNKKYILECIQDSTASYS